MRPDSPKMSIAKKKKIDPESQEARQRIWLLWWWWWRKYDDEFPEKKNPSSSIHDSPTNQLKVGHHPLNKKNEELCHGLSLTRGLRSDSGKPLFISITSSFLPQDSALHFLDLLLSPPPSLLSLLSSYDPSSPSQLLRSYWALLQGVQRRKTGSFRHAVYGIQQTPLPIVRSSD